MTGFAKTNKSVSFGNIDLTIKTVNNKNCEVSVKLPKLLFPYENEIISAAKQKLQRGKICIFIELTESENKKITINKIALKQCLAEINSLKKEIPDLNLSCADFYSLLRLPEMIEIQNNDITPENFKTEVLDILFETLEKLNIMRTGEGANLLPSILSYIAEIKNQIIVIKNEIPVSINSYKTKLEKIIGDIANSSIEDKEKKIMNELGLYADKIDITEEIERLSSHLMECEKLLTAEDFIPVGRTLEFIVQELNREINTASVKSGSFAISQSVIVIKNLIDKIKEQSMNLV